MTKYFIEITAVSKSKVTIGGVIRHWKNRCFRVKSLLKRGKEITPSKFFGKRNRTA